MSTVKARKAMITAAKDFLTANSSIVTASGTITGLPTLVESRISWESRIFETTGKEPWASVFFNPNTPDGRTVGFRGYDQFTGFLQIDFNVAPGKGNETLTDWEDKGRIYFHGGRAFTYDGQGLTIVSCGMSAGRHVDNFYRKSLTVSYRAHIKRNEVL